MDKKISEWLKQADYDMETADLMFDGGRYFYAVFMCHLSIEKSLKGLYQERLNKIPPKVHNLVYLLKEIGVVPPEAIGRFLIKLNEANVVTRYPENLDKLKENYTQSVVEEMLAKSKEALEWIKAQF